MPTGSPEPAGTEREEAGEVADQAPRSAQGEESSAFGRCVAHAARSGARNPNRRCADLKPSGGVRAGQGSGRDTGKAKGNSGKAREGSGKAEGNSGKARGTSGNANGNSGKASDEEKAKKGTGKAKGKDDRKGRE